MGIIAPCVSDPEACGSLRRQGLAAVRVGAGTRTPDVRTQAHASCSRGRRGVCSRAAGHSGRLALVVLSCTCSPPAQRREAWSPIHTASPRPHSLASILLLGPPGLRLGPLRPPLPIHRWLVRRAAFWLLVHKIEVVTEPRVLVCTRVHA